MSKRKTIKGMRCKDFNDDLIFFAEGSLPEKRKVEVESHLKECEECRNFLQVLQEAYIFIEKDKIVETDPFIFTRIMSKLEAPEAVRRAPSLKLVPSMVAATVFFAAVTGGVMLGRFCSFSSQPNELILGEEIRFLDEISQEPIESYFLNLRDEGYEQE
jgi:anti-sigma factor RsiW